MTTPPLTKQTDSHDPAQAALEAYLEAWREEWRALGASEHDLIYPKEGIEATKRCLDKALAAYRRAGWHKLSECLPPSDGTPFELQMRRVRYFVTWEDSYDRVTSVALDRAAPRRLPTFCSAYLLPEDIIDAKEGWWRLIPNDGPPEK